MNKPRILFLDIETSPNLAYVWGKYQQDVIAFKEEWSIISVAWKWADKGVVACLSTVGVSEKALLMVLHSAMNRADLIVAHNGDAFDIKKIKARMISYKLSPLKMVPTVDTYKVAKRYFNFNSNKLTDLCSHLGLGRKVKTNGFDLWLGCMQGDRKSWALMEKYNKHDVILLEKLYNKFLPWMHTHPNMAKVEGHKEGCSKCGSKKVQKRGTYANSMGLQQNWWCRSCDGWYKAKVSK